MLLSHTSYNPQVIFDGNEGKNSKIPRVLIAPQRYIQGDGILDALGRYLSLVPSSHAAILISEGGQKREGTRILESLRASKIESTFISFSGECSYCEVERVVKILQAQTNPVDCLVAFGGGKCIDAGKSIAYRLGIPVAICPSLASNDAPCSALSVMYTEEGVFEDVEFFPHNPALVAVDTGIVAKAPVRYLVAGIGDAMATWYEARTCLQNPQSRSVIGARPTLAASAIGELCANTLFKYGLSAIEAVKNSEVNEALETIVEANTLLSGIGFESGGLAVAHSIAQGLTVVREVHQNYLHGEMVAIGVLTQLVLERKVEEALKVAEFFAQVGLPVNLDQISLSKQHKVQLDETIAAAITLPFVNNEPFTVTNETLLSAISQADDLGIKVSHSIGDFAYRTIRKRY